MRLLIPLFFFTFFGLLADAAVTETLDQTYPVAADATLSLGNINGSVTVDTWDRPEVRVVAVKRASSQEDLDAIEIKVTASADTVDVKTKYNRDEGSFFGRWNSSGDVKYTVTVPRGARLKDVKTVNGSIHVDGVEGPVHVSSVNGSIEANGLRHDAKIRTVNGHVVAQFAAVDADQDIEIDSVNGKSEVVLPADANCGIKARTVHGSIRNDFDLEVAKSWGPGRKLDGQLGAGDGKVSISTVNGSIRVSKAAATL